MNWNWNENWKKFQLWTETNQFVMLVVFIIVNVILAIIGTVLIYTRCSIDSGNVWNYGGILFGLQIIYTALSFKIVGTEELGALLVFERPVYEVRSGIVFVPWLICGLRRESRLTIQMQIPGEPEEVDKSGDDNRGLIAGKKYLPIRVTTSSYEIVMKDSRFANDPALVEGDPLNNRMTLEPSAQIRFKIKDIIRFVQVIGSLKEAQRQLRDTAEGSIQSEFGRRTPALILAHRDEISKILRVEIGKLVKDDTCTPDSNEWWGIEIDTAQLLDIDINKKVNVALSLATAAKINKVTTVIDAEAAKEKKKQEGLGSKEFKIAEGEGAAKARELILLAEAAGLAKLAEISKTPEGQLNLIVQQAKEMYQNSQYSILPGNGEGLFGTVAGIQEVLKRIQGNGKKPETVK
ncbi:MAG: SPFH domain-containing protein [Minisyncoccia bacterium]